MMPRVTISEESVKILEQHSRTGEVSDVIALGDGTFSIHLDADVAERLAKINPNTDVAIATLVHRVN
jgi:hypothetical protein